MLDLVIYTCAHRSIDAGTVTAMEMFRLYSKVNYLWLVLTGDALIGRARSICCSRFYKDWLAKKVSSSPYMIFIDDDILFKPDDINRLYRDLKNGNELVGGAYPVKDGMDLACTGYGEDQPFDGRLIDCTYLATGFMGFSATLIDKMVKDLKMPRWRLNPTPETMMNNLPLLHKGIWCETYPFFENVGVIDSPFGFPMWLSEDYDFCEKAIKVGVTPKLDTGIQLSHIGQKIYRFQEVAEAHAKRRQDAQPK